MTDVSHRICTRTGDTKSKKTFMNGLSLGIKGFVALISAFCILLTAL